MQVFVTVFGFLIWLSVYGAPLHGEALSRLYTEQAHKLALADDEVWQRLLFYERHSLVRGPHGLVDDPLFYLARDGKSNASAELAATLEAFFQLQTATEPDQHALCRFPARRSYLEQKMEGLATSLPKVSCPRFETWWKDRHYESVSLVFSSFYPDNPASMFGHIFLRLHRSQRGASSDLLDDSINFAAFTNTNNPLLYNIKGVSGYFPGRFSLMPYYMKIQEYNNLESRDLWEYPLKASKEQLQRILLSLWEFGPHFANYYYFDDNCSYVMLMLMETGDVSWNLTGQNRVWSTPSSSLKAVVDQPGFILETRFRPSALSRYQERYDQLSGSEKHRFAQLIDPKKSGEKRETSVRVLDSVLEYIDFQEKLAGTQAPVRFAALRHDLLLQRSQAGEAPLALERRPADRDPRLAVSESWVMLSGAERDDQSFLRLSWQPVLHDLLGENKGYANDMQLQIMPMSFSLDLESQTVALDKVDVLNVISVQPYNRRLQPKSWMFQLGYERQVLCQSEIQRICPESRLSYSRGAAASLGQGSYAPLGAGFLSLSTGAEQVEGQNVAFFQAGPEVLLHGTTPWSQSYALRGLWARRWNAEGYADWYVKSDLQMSLRLARLQQVRLNASWEQKNSDREEPTRSDIQLGILQHF
ncbi:MAG TPA: DUF4105 domain-containing protein [Oligoflexus sp.]|uniref:Lnb N-terminal periplasmic domain-containing protein n=1 Tax=Oligoflexus sp. TaxID=1971216 RepID=UPI002D75D4D3|nr:DUF4105 domain-containing protein [Oligoflexus sp.]HYX35511.1 DUF4105 domain-containing protein [Oligoflexus sp.]